MFGSSKVDLRSFESSYRRVTQVAPYYYPRSSWRNEPIVSELLSVTVLEDSQALQPYVPPADERNPPSRLVLTHTLQLVSASAVVLRSEVFPTMIMSDEACTVDYLWVSRSVGVVSMLSPPDLKTIYEMGPMPNMQYPSDHFSLVFELDY